MTEIWLILSKLICKVCSVSKTPDESEVLAGAGCYGGRIARFELVPKTVNVNSTANSHGKEVPNSWSGYRKTMRTKTCAVGGTNNNYYYHRHVWQTHMTVTNLPEVAFQTAQFAQRQVDVWKLLTKLLIQLLLEVTGTHVINHWRLEHYHNRLLQCHWKGMPRIQYNNSIYTVVSRSIEKR